MLVWVRAALRQQAQAAARLAAIERKVDLIMARLRITDPSPEVLAAVRHLEAGEPLEAIRAYRDGAGVDLAEARVAVDRIRREYGLDSG